MSDTSLFFSTFKWLENKGSMIGIVGLDSATNEILDIQSGCMHISIFHLMSFVMDKNKTNWLSVCTKLWPKVQKNADTESLG